MSLKVKNKILIVISKENINQSFINFLQYFIAHLNELEYDIFIYSDSLLRIEYASNIQAKFNEAFITEKIKNIGFNKIHAFHHDIQSVELIKKIQKKIGKCTLLDESMLHFNQNYLINEFLKVGFFPIEVYNVKNIQELKKKSNNIIFPINLIINQRIIMIKDLNELYDNIVRLDLNKNKVFITNDTFLFKNFKITFIKDYKDQIIIINIIDILNGNDNLNHKDLLSPSIFIKQTDIVKIRSILYLISKKIQHGVPITLEFAISSYGRFFLKECFLGLGNDYHNNSFFIEGNISKLIALLNFNKSFIELLKENKNEFRHFDILFPKNNKLIVNFKTENDYLKINSSGYHIYDTFQSLLDQIEFLKLNDEIIKNNPIGNILVNKDYKIHKNQTASTIINDKIFNIIKLFHSKSIEFKNYSLSFYNKSYNKSFYSDILSSQEIKSSNKDKFAIIIDSVYNEHNAIINNETLINYFINQIPDDVNIIVITDNLIANLKYNQRVKEIYNDVINVKNVQNILNNIINIRKIPVYSVFVNPSVRFKEILFILQEYNIVNLNINKAKLNLIFNSQNSLITFCGIHDIPYDTNEYIVEKDHIFSVIVNIENDKIMKLRIIKESYTINNTYLDFLTDDNDSINPYIQDEIITIIQNFIANFNYLGLIQFKFFAKNNKIYLNQVSLDLIKIFNILSCYEIDNINKDNSLETTYKNIISIFKRHNVRQNLQNAEHFLHYTDCTIEKAYFKYLFFNNFDYKKIENIIFIANERNISYATRLVQKAYKANFKILAHEKLSYYLSQYNIKNENIGANEKEVYQCLSSSSLIIDLSDFYPDLMNKIQSNKLIYINNKQEAEVCLNTFILYKSGCNIDILNFSKYD